MAGATFSRSKNWIAESLTYEDLNAEIDNILTNLDPSGVDDYSANLAQMQIQTSPGTLGAESLATSLAGEIARLRFTVQRIIGGSTSYYYEAPSNSLGDLTAALGTGLPRNRIVSGASKASSSQLVALDPSISTNAVTLLGNSVSFNYYVNGVQYTIASDVLVSGLSAAPSANNTCLVNDALATDSQDSEGFGQYGTTIHIDTAGSEVTALIGEIAAFKKGDEYFTAYVESATELTNAFRGCFFDGSGAPLPAETLLNNDTITLMRLSWIFASSTLGLAVTYNNPIISAVEPSSPATGDYWFDLVGDTWKTFNSTAWVSAGSTLIGWAVQDATNCVAARTFDQFVAISDINNLELESSSVTAIRSRNIDSVVSIFGVDVTYSHSRPVWAITSDLESGYSEASGKTYYAYLTEAGASKLSPVLPQLRNELLGFYHPTETWRCVGWVANDGSSDFTSPTYTLRGIRDLPFYTNGMVFSASSEAFSTGTGSLAAVTNLSVTLRTKGRPIVVMLVSKDGGTDRGGVTSLSGANGLVTEGYVRLTVTPKNAGSATSLGDLNMSATGNAGTPSSGSVSLGVPSSAFTWLYTGAVGDSSVNEYTFAVSASSVNANYLIQVSNCRLLAYEI